MNSTLEHGLKRGADDIVYHSTKRMRLINHAYDNIQPTRGTKRRDRDEMEDISTDSFAIPPKRNKVTPFVKRMKRKGDSLIMNPTKRIKTVHRTWRRSIQGCRLFYDAEYDNDKDEDHYMVSVAIIA